MVMERSRSPAAAAEGRGRAPNPALPYREDCWSDGETSALVDAWGCRYLEVNRGHLRQPQWQEVADAVNGRHGAAARRRPPRTDIQCKNRVDTLKKKYKTERSRRSPSSWVFFDRMDTLVGPLLAMTPPVGPPVGGGGDGGSGSSKRPSPSPSPPLIPFPFRRKWSPIPAAPVRLPVHNNNSSFLQKAAAAAAAAAKPEENYNQEADDDDDDSLSASSIPRSTKRRRKLVGRGDMPEDEKMGNGVKELARAIEGFAAMYERVEAARQRHELEMERQRMEFLKDMELQRLQSIADSQVQIEKIKRSRKDLDSGEMARLVASTLSFLSPPAFL